MTAAAVRGGIGVAAHTAGALAVLDHAYNGGAGVVEHAAWLLIRDGVTHPDVLSRRSALRELAGCADWAADAPREVAVLRYTVAPDCDDVTWAELVEALRVAAGLLFAGTAEERVARTAAEADVASVLAEAVTR